MNTGVITLIVLGGIFVVFLLAVFLVDPSSVAGKEDDEVQRWCDAMDRHEEHVIRGMIQAAMNEKMLAVLEYYADHDYIVVNRFGVPMFFRNALNHMEGWLICRIYAELNTLPETPPIPQDLFDAYAQQIVTYMKPGEKWLMDSAKLLELVPDMCEQYPKLKALKNGEPQQNI